MAALTFRSVAIREMPGFPVEEGFQVAGLQDGLNVVWGPNGIGKSTLARAMRLLLWADGAPPPAACNLAAQAELNGETWAFERKAGVRSAHNLARPATALGTWTSQETSDRYWFPLHELLQTGSGRDPFHAIIRRQLQDGVDFPTLRSAAGAIDRFSSAALQETRTLKAATTEVQRITEEQRNQGDLAGAIQALDRRIQQAQAATQDLTRARAALDVHHLEARIRDLETRLAGFPATLQRLQPEDWARMEELEAAATALRLTLDAAGRRRAETAQELARNGLADDLVQDPTHLELLRRDVQALATAGQELQAAELALQIALQAESAWGQAHAWLAATPPVPFLESALATLKAAAQRSESVRCALEAARRTRDTLGPAVPLDPTQVAGLGELQVRLQDWLAAQALAATGPAPARRGTTLAVTLALALAAAALALLISPWFSLVGLLGPLAGLALGRAAGHDRTTGPLAARCAQVQSQALALGLGAPEAWTPAGVARWLGAAAKAQGDLRAQEAQNQARTAADAVLRQALTAQQNLQAELHGFATALGLRPGEAQLEGALLYFFAQDLHRWGELRLASGRCQGARGWAATAAEQAAATLRAHLEALTGAPAAPDPEALAAQVASLQLRVEARRELLAAHSALERQIEATTPDLRAAVAKALRFWSDRGLTPDQKAELQGLCAQVPAYRQLREALEAARSRRLAEPERAALAGFLDPDGTPEQLEARIQGLETEAEGLGGLREERGRLDQRLRGFLQGNNLALARSARQQALEALEQLRRQAVLNRAVGLLCDHLKARSESEDQPRVLRKAADLFRRFTHHRYALQAHEGGFVARDLVQESLHTLDQLSSGTRVQLLLSVRLAFIEEQEGAGGIRLPIFLDEVLANSDDERARAIVEALLGIAKERQVFYFTAQRDEVAKWLGHPGPCHGVELAALRRGERALARPLPRLDPRPSPIPEPVTDYRAYGALCGAAGASLWTEVAQWHAWHLLEDSRSLQALLQRGLERVGQVERYLLQAKPTALPFQATAAEQIQILRHALELARLGHGRPVTLTILDRPDFPALSRTVPYFGALVAVLRDSGGDGRRVLAALPTLPRLRRVSQEAIAGFLRDQGFVATGEPLETREILARIVPEHPAMTLDSSLYRVTARLLAGLRTGSGREGTSAG